MTTIPKSFYQSTQRVLVDIPPDAVNPLWCDNCNGRGFITGFLVSHGPYLHVPPANKGEALKTVDDKQYGWVWYTGKLITDQCPVCLGTGKRVKKAIPDSYTDH